LIPELHTKVFYLNRLMVSFNYVSTYFNLTVKYIVIRNVYLLSLAIFIESSME